MIKMTEPMRWQKFLEMMNGWMAKNDVLMHWTPILADVFVFTYPVYLLAMYFYGIGKKKDYYKEASLMLFLAWFGSIFVNLIVQLFVEKVRPDVVLDLFVNGRDNLLLENIPASTFPSDHAAMAAAIATTTLLWGIKNKDKKFLWMSVPLALFAIIMGFGRITVGIHRPTDILVGTIVGIIVSLILFQKNIIGRLKKYLFRWIVDLQKWLWGVMGMGMGK